MSLTFSEKVCSVLLALPLSCLIMFQVVFILLSEELISLEILLLYTLFYKFLINSMKEVSQEGDFVAYSLPFRLGY